ncbi:MAG: NosD domain-containing protein [Methanospirillum sp.]
MKGWPFFRLALLAALLLFSSNAVPVAATDVTYAGQAITIASPGSYVLTNDIVNSGQLTCIEIRASDVVFDGAGHLIDGKDIEGSTGISVYAPEGARNVTVRDVRIRDWDRGIYLDGAVNSSIESSVLENNLFCGAVLYRNATGNSVRGCTITGNGYGLVLSDGAADCVVSDSRIESNECGLYLYDSDGVTVTRNVIANSTDIGLQVHLSGSGTFYDNRFGNTVNVAVASEPVRANAWSVAPRDGPNIVGGPSIGGNYWARPGGTGFSEVTADGDDDGFADVSLSLAPQNIDEHPLAPSVGFVPTPEATPTYELPTIETPPPTLSLPTFTPTATPSATVNVTPTIVVPGGAGYAGDPDGDGRYEDVNGNGRQDFADVVLFFNQVAWIAENAPVSVFDHNDNGRIDFGDIVALFGGL